MTKPENPSAFPRDYRNIPGMTLRDYFAGQALAGMCASDHASMNYGAEDFSSEAYMIADAMLAERAKEAK